MVLFTVLRCEISYGTSLLIPLLFSLLPDHLPSSSSFSSSPAADDNNNQTTSYALSSFSYLSSFASDKSLSFSPPVLNSASSSSSSASSFPYLPGLMTQGCWPIKRPSLSDLWCWVMSRGLAQKAPTGWGICVVMETVSGVQSPQCHLVHVFEMTRVCVSSLSL